MRRKQYLSANRFYNNSIALVDSRSVDYHEVPRLVDDSYFVPSTEAVKRIRNLGQQSLQSLYDSDLALKNNVTPEYVRHPSRDIVEVQRFTELAYAKVEDSLKKDISEHEKRRVQAEKDSLDKTKVQLDVILKDSEVVKKE